MKFDKQQKVTIIILAILIIGATISIIPKLVNSVKNIKQEPIFIAKKIELKEEFPPIAKKYKIFTDMFEQNEPVLVYGYTQGHLNTAQSEIFDKKLNKLLEKEKIQHKVISYKNWKTTTNAIQEKYIDNDATCTMVTKEQETLESYLSFIKNCFTSACIIDVKNKNYIKINRNTEFIIKIIKGEITPQY